MKNFKYKRLFTLSLISLIMAGCRKQDELLDKKPNEAFNTPSTIQDLQLLLQNESIFNTLYPSYGETSSDDFYFDYSTWLNVYPSERNAYIWAKQIYSGSDIVTDWNAPYQMVYYANTILTSLPNISVSANQQSQYNTVQGSALFFRSIAFYNLLQEFALPYNKQTAGTDLGIPLPLMLDVDAKLSRSTVEKCYQQIIQDLNLSVSLLPDLPAQKTAPSKAAALAMLSRVYLIMADYLNSETFAAKSLNIYSRLQDFNKLNSAAVPVYPLYSPEELFHAGLSGSSTTSDAAQVDSNLLKLYNAPYDLRPTIFFRTSATGVNFNSQFDKEHAITYSVSTAEMLLNKAECEARLNDSNAALNDLNTLLVNRWKTGSYQPYAGLDAESALKIILQERRKELVMTTIRWSDLRRLNLDPQFAKTIQRVMNGTTYILPPNDPRYVLPIPQNEIDFNPIPQNTR